MNIRWERLYSGSLHAFHASPRIVSSAEKREQAFRRFVTAAIIFGLGGFVLMTVGVAFSST